MPYADPSVFGDPLRLAKLNKLHLMDDTFNPAFDRLTRLASKIIKVPVSLVSLVDAHDRFFKSQSGLGDSWASLRRAPLTHSHCQHVVATGKPLIITDARLHALTHDLRAVKEMNAIAYVGMPLTTSDGFTLGSFCVVDTVPRVWTEDELEILAELSLSVTTEIELQSQLIERAEIEAALRDSQRFAESIVTAIPDLVYVFDLETQLTVFSNRSRRDGLEYTSDEIQAMGETLIGNLVHPDDLERVMAHHDVYRGLQDGEAAGIEYRVLNNNGKWIWLHSRDTVFQRNEQAQPAQIIGIAQDITRRKAAETELHELIEQMKTLRRVEGELGERLDLESVLMVAMDTALRISGADDGTISLVDGDEVQVAHGVGHYTSGMRFPRGLGIVERVMRTGRAELIAHVEDDPDYTAQVATTLSQIVVPLKHRERAIGVLHLETGSPERFTQERFEFLQLISGRITIAIENAQLYQLSQNQLVDLQTLYFRVRDLELMKTDMIRIAAHDLRNPLGLVLGYTELLLEDMSHLDEAQQEFVQSIYKGGQKIRKIITDILSLDRFENTAQNSTHSVFDFSTLVSNVAAEYGEIAQSRGQQFTVDLPNLALNIYGDEAQIREAVENLVNNAIKYTPETGAIRVMARLSNSGDRAVLEVNDTGYGIPEAAQSNLFQPFYRVKMEETSQVEGTGLGLHLVKNIVERHQGKMRFRSVHGKGSTFGFELPVMRPDDTRPLILPVAVKTAQR